MKRRITFIQGTESPFEPHQAVLSSSTLSVRALEAAREDRITFDLSDLPEEVRTVLEKSHELRLRWASEHSYDAVPPFPSRISPGLHVHYTPLEADKSSQGLCSFLRKAFGTEEGQYAVNCARPQDAFITPPLLSTTIHAASAPLQYYTELPSLKSLVAFIRRLACHQLQAGGAECHGRADSLLTADAVDIDYDNASHTLRVTGLWASAPTGGWTEDIHKPSSDEDQVEFGLLGVEQAIHAKDIKMGGLLAVVGKDKKLKPTMFSFPSRHHSLPMEASYTVSFNKPTGLHPTMAITMSRSALHRPPAPEEATCALYTYLTLPSSVFGDQYQLGTTDPLFLQSHNLVALRAHAGEMDLEAPDWAVQAWGSTWLFELSTPEHKPADAASNWTATIPLHLRYLRPSESGYRAAHVPWPIIFWACTPDDDSTMGVNPFDRTSLGWDELFAPSTMFYQLHPQTEQLVEKIDVPVLQLKDSDGLFQARNIELGTSAVIVLGFLWVLWRLFRVSFSRGSTRNERVHDKKE
ncbi:Protein pbn1 [Penicillium macrosclerotiorum]|uniref:Protein pbn1 n=1 Tax=Penicillium macrosclerotiorum TaxID=303699 RepID=UPI0025478DBD|nr:Protein pbn1 [Penicillium macrosclerotiorum]KAJ5689090.1 Protein pbn1 [Penicillium macrosclerotiorum]